MRRGRGLVLGGAIAAGAVALGVASRLEGAVVLVLGGALVVLDVVLLRWHGGTAPAHGQRDVDDRIISGIAAAWVVVALLPMHDIGRQSATTAVTSLTLQTGVELLVFGAIGALCALVSRTVLAWSPVGAALAILPVWVAASAAWAEAPSYAVGRGIEYVALLLLAGVTAAVGARSRRALEQLLAAVLRSYALVTVLLVVAGFVLGPFQVVVTAANRDRFTWIGAHPTESGFVLGTALLILVATGAERLRLPGPVRLAAIAVVAAALYENQTRTVLAGLLVAVAVLLLLRMRQGSGTAWFASYVAGAGGLVTAVLAGGAVVSYVLRGGDWSTLTSLNGRRDLWAVGLAALEGPADWLLGLGYGATRTTFVGDFAFAGNAHNSLLGTLVSLGLVGVVIVVAAIGRALVLLVRTGMLGSSAGRTLLGAFIYTIVAGVSSDALAEPHAGLALLFLVSGAASGWQAGATSAAPDRYEVLA